MTDLSFNIVALDKATATFVRMAEQVDRLAARIDKLDGKNATVDVNIKTDKANASIDLLDTRFKRLTTGIIAAAPLAGGAIIGGLGAAFIAAAAAATSSNEEVKQSYKTLWGDVVNETKAGANQIVPQIVASGQILDAEMQALGPQIKQAFTLAGPDVIALSQGLGDFAHNIMPGVTASMQNSLPVFEGVKSTLGQLGQSGGNALQSMSQHAQAYGRDVQSAGAVADGALTGATGIVNALGETWAQNADSIDSSVTSLGGSISGLATGAVPALSAGLGVVADTTSVVLGILQPLSPLLGTVGGVALATWAAFKVAGLAEAGIKALASGVVTLGGNLEATAAKGAATIASMKGVEIESSLAARSMVAAGTASATAAVGFGAAASAIAGPLGIALVAGITLWSLFSGSEDEAASSSVDMRQATDDLTSALIVSKGALDDQVISALKNEKGFKDAAASGKQFGITQNDLVAAITQGGPALDALRKKLQAVIDAHVHLATTGDGQVIPNAPKIYDEEGAAALALLGNLNGLSGAFDISVEDQKKLAAQTHNTNVGLLSTAASTGITRDAAHALGISLSDLNLGFLGVMDSGAASGDNMQAVAEAFIQSALKIADSQQAITDHFKSADKAVAQAKQGVDDAAHSYQQSSRAISDAEHSLEAAHRGVVQAEQAVVDAHRQVTTAEESYQTALQSERAAQQAVSVARRQAIQDLKDLHLQLQDQVVSEKQAEIRLLDAQTAASGAGISSLDQAKRIVSQKVTADNEQLINTALDYIGAQNALNDSLNSGAKLRRQVTDADKAGVAGATGVINAQQQLKAAHKQVADASYGVEQAQKNLQRAEQQVTDAAYQEQRAHQAVADAQYQRTRAAQQLKSAQDQLKTAQDNDSHSLSLNTAAGRENLKMLLGLWDSINATGLSTQDKYNTLINDVAHAFGISKDKAAAYLVQLGLIPKDFKYGITAVAGVDWNSYEHTFSKATAMIRDRGGFAEGGHVTGPGGPRDDKIRAWLSNGEFVVNADATAKNRDLLEAINNGAPGFAAGGLVDFITGLGLGMAGASYTSNANAGKVMGTKHPKGLPKYVPEELPPGPGHVSGIPSSVSGNRATVLDVFSKMFGWSGAGMVNAIDFLLMHESGYRNTAQNPTSSAYGMFQFLDSTWGGYGVRKTSDPRQQAIAGGRYIKGRYGNPIGAQRFWAGHHWYDEGGYLPEEAGVGSFAKGPGREMVLPPEMTALMEGFARAVYGSPTTSMQASASRAAAATAVVIAQQAPSRGTFVGQLVLDSGQLLGTVRGQMTQVMGELEHAAGLSAGG